MDVNGTHQVLAYADEVNLLNIGTIERKTDVLLSFCSDIGLAVNTGKYKGVEIGCNQVMIANEHIKIGSSNS